MPGFEDFAVAARARDALAMLVENEIARQRPRIQYAVVDSIDRPNRKAMVTFAGDPTPVKVNLGVIQPSAVGQTVRIDGPVGDRFISDVLGSAYLPGTIAGTLPASQVTTGTFGAGNYVFPADLTVNGQFEHRGVFPNNARFWSGLEIAHEASTPFIDFHRSTNPEEATDYNVRLINDSNGWLHLNGSFQVDGLVKAGDGSGNGYAFATYGGGWYMQDNTWIRAHNNKNIYTGGNVEVTGEIRSDTRFYCASGVRDDMVELGPYLDYKVGVRSQTLFLTANLWLAMDTRSGGANRMFDWHRSDGCYLRNNAWYRTQGSGGFYLADALFGWNSAGGGSRTAKTENNECRIRIDRVSQGGWASAAVENRGASFSVPQYAYHADGERANMLRKDNGGWNGVWVDQNANCASFFSAGFGTCSDEARKTDISVVDDLGLKTVRGLVPKTYRYHPVTEEQIWATEKDRAERAEGKWQWRVGVQESWDDWHVGYMAEEIYNRFPGAAFLDPVDGRPWAIDYGKLVIAAIAAINELADRIEDLEAERGWRRAA